MAPVRPGPPLPLVLGAAAAIAMAASVAMMGERGAFHARESAGTVAGIPGVTVDDEGGGAMPVITSLRSHCQAERLGIRVGDRIADIDGRPVRDAAELRRIVATRGPGRRMALHISRGGALWTIAIDGAGGHDSQDLAG